MPDPRIAVWNTLHDGQITALGRESADTVVMFVTIPYLRTRIEPLGDSFCLRLRGCRSIEFAGAGSMSTSSLAEIAAEKLDILSTDSEFVPVRVATPQGFLVLDFDSLDISLDTGEHVEYQQLDRVCEEYWSEWSAGATHLTRRCS